MNNKTISRKLNTLLKEGNSDIRKVILCMGTHMNGEKERGIIIKSEKDFIALYKSELENILKFLNLMTNE